MTRLEVLCTALARANGAFEPSSDAFRLCNPLLIKSFGKPGRHDIDPEGRRIFSSFINGYKAGFFDLGLKVSGRSRANLKGTDTVANLLAVYGRPKHLIVEVIGFCRHAFGDPLLAEDIPLSFFTEQ